MLHKSGGEQYILWTASVLILGALFLIPSSAPKKTSSGNAIVEISAEGFSPKNLTINLGDPVRFINKDARARWPASDPHPTHDFLSGFDPQRPIESDSSWSFVFTTEGKWSYHDHLIPHQKGEIIVIGESDTNVLSRFRDFLNLNINKTNSPATAESAPEELKQLLAEKNTKKQAKIVRAMAEKYGPREALQLMQRSGLPQTGETHLLVHEIGNVAYERYGQSALLYCDESFLSACYHGVVLNEIGDRGIAGVARLIEECRSAGPHIYAQCSHAAGHGFLAYNNYKVLEALPFCDQLGEFAQDIPTFNCRDGIFMENIFGVHNGKPSPNRMVKTDDPYYPCNAVPEKYRDGCFANQATLMYQLFDGNLRKVAEHCDKVGEEKYKEICYNNFARQIHPLTEGKTERAKIFCANATGQWKDQCILTLVSAAFSVGDRTRMPYELCESLQGSPKYSQCYEELFGLIASYGNTEEKKLEFCGYIREDVQKTECEKRFGVTPKSSDVALRAISPNSREAIEEIKTISKKQGVKSAYKHIKTRWGSDTAGAHDLAHLAGNLAFEELDINGISVCDNNFAFGCYHGFLERLIREKGNSAIGFARNGCSALSPSGQKASCIHGIGHGIFVEKQSDISKSIDICNTFSDFEKTYCFDGVFMEYYTGAMKDGAPPISFSENDPWKFCLGMPEFTQAQCVRNHTFFILYNPRSALDYAASSCNMLESKLKNNCLDSFGLFATQRAREDIKQIIKICNSFKDENDSSFCRVSATKELIFRGKPESLARELCTGLNPFWEKSCLSGIRDVIALYKN